MAIIKRKHILFGTIRFYEGQPFLQDIAKALNYTDETYKHLVSSYIINKDGYELIDDNGIETLITKSNIKTPIVFSQWIFDFVLPSLRKNRHDNKPSNKNESSNELLKKPTNELLNESFLNHLKSIKGWITIPVHGFSNNYMYSYTKNGNIVKSKAYYKWRQNFPTEYLNKLSHIDFNKPIQAYYVFDHKEEFDTPNFDKSISDMIVDYFGVDDHQIINVICIKGKTVNTFDEGKTHVFLYNI